MPAARLHTLPKEERLSGKTGVKALMESGRWGGSGDIRFCWLKRPGEKVNRIMVSVPKKHFKRAVKRNLLKRRMRESYRLQKELLAPRGIDLLLVYTALEIKDFASISEQVAGILSEVSHKAGA